MKTKVRHLLGISGGKDSAALAIYLKSRYPSLPLEFYTADTGKELDETYQLIKNLEVYLGVSITLLKAADQSSEAPFDHFLKMYGGYLPSTNSRWCTKKLKLEPFENYVGIDPVISYVGIRGDEDREGYISTKKNIQSIFPFRKNIWSVDVISKCLANSKVADLLDLNDAVSDTRYKNALNNIIRKPLTEAYSMSNKLNELLNVNVLSFNRIVFSFLKNSDYPLSLMDDFALLDNEDVLVRDDIFRILDESGVGVPGYYKGVEFQINGKSGQYSRSRSGCYFCFYQQKIEWIWLYEQHPDLFKKAMEYEKDGYTWNQEESLEQMIVPDRMQKIKEDYLKRQQRNSVRKSPYLLDILTDAEGEGCASCFI